MSPTRSAALLLASVTLDACSDASRNLAAVERDSAAVTIVESAAPRYPERLWSIDTIPLLDLATSGTGVAHEFSDVVACSNGSCGCRASTSR